MENSIRHFIKQNFKDATDHELCESINQAIASKDEVALPGLGVLFEVLWEHSDNSFKETSTKTILEYLK